MSSTTSSASTGNEISLLSQAVICGDSNRARRRLSKLFGDDVNQRRGEERRGEERRALVHAVDVRFGVRHLNIARLLMREGADVTLKDSGGFNLIHSAIISSRLT